MRILVGCEESQAVTIAFRNKGHEAYSCDLQECSGGHPEWHLQGDIFDYLMHGMRIKEEPEKPFWDMAIIHPPCTFLSNAGIGYFNEEKYGDKARKRKGLREDAARFFFDLWEWPIDKICLENPVGYINGIMSPTQVIHPYYFGDPHKKRTCLWLKGLPPLAWTKQDDLFGVATSSGEPEPLSVQIRKPGKHYKGGEAKKRYFTDVYGGSKSSAKKRSKTFQGIANAMAEQWG